MDVRKKLAELLEEISYDWELRVFDLWDMRDGAEVIAELLIAHGVTVQEWISVTERSPEGIGLYLVIEKHWLDGSRGIKIAKWNTVDWFTADRKSNEITPRVTHWMPLPKPPKGE